MMSDAEYFYVTKSLESTGVEVLKSSAEAEAVYNKIKEGDEFSAVTKQIAKQHKHEWVRLRSLLVKIQREIVSERQEPSEKNIYKAVLYINKAFENVKKDIEYFSKKMHRRIDEEMDI